MHSCYQRQATERAAIVKIFLGRVNSVENFPVRRLD